MSKVCKFYLQGNCHYGSSCRFSHSDNNNRPRHSNSQYYEDCRPKNNRNVKQLYFDEYEDHKSGVYDDYYEQNNRYSGRTNNKYYEKEDYNNKNNYDYQTKKEHNVKNYYKEHEKNVDSNVNSNSNPNRKGHYTTEFNHHKEEYYTQNNKFKSNSNSNSYKNSADRFNPNNKIEQGVNVQKEKLLKFYDKEIAMYRSHVKELLNSNIWPFTCFHPVGHVYPIQTTGSLNFLDISFEEIRCDYYITKTLCASPGPIHKQSVDSLLSIARKQKEDIISFVDNVHDDMLEVFEKCEESKNNRNFQNTIETDPNSYWDMCYNNLDMFEANQALTKSYSFINDNEEKKKKTDYNPSLKIYMQTKVYGNIKCKAYEDEEFTNYIPILPPPKKCCF